MKTISTLFTEAMLLIIKLSKQACEMGFMADVSSNEALRRQAVSMSTHGSDAYRLAAEMLSDGKTYEEAENLLNLVKQRAGWVDRQFLTGMECVPSAVNPEALEKFRAKNLQGGIEQ